MNVNLAKGKKAELIIRSNERASDVANRFAVQHKLGKDETRKLIKILGDQLKILNESTP